MNLLVCATDKGARAARLCKQAACTRGSYETNSFVLYRSSSKSPTEKPEVTS